MSAPTFAESTTRDVPTSDPEAIGQCWDAIVAPGDVHEVRIPKSRRGPLRLHRTVSGYFDNRDAFVRAVSPIAGADAQSVYVTLNPAKPALLARAANRLENDARTTTSDADIDRLTHLLIDTDPIRPADISATNTQRDNAVKVRDLVWHYLRDELGWPLPSVITMSGNGGGVLYRIDLPNDPEAVALLQRTLQGLSALFSTDQVTIDTTTYNPARITKIVGTVAAKGDHLPEYPWRQATGRFNPNPQTVAPEHLDAIAAFAPKPEPRSSMNGHAAGMRSWDVREVLRRNGVDFTEKSLGYATSFALDRCLTSPDHTSGACILEFPNGALSYTCRHNRCQGKRWEDVRGTLGLPTGTSPTISSQDATEKRSHDPSHRTATTARTSSGSCGSASPRPEPAWPILDPAALHGLAGDVVRAILPHTEADPTALLVTFQALYGNAVGPTPHLMVGDDRHGVNEFFALVGETAKARKGSSRSGPQRIMKTVDPVWAADRILGGLSSGEGLLVVIADEVTRPNKKGEEEIVVQGTTDKRLFCFEEELSQFLKVCRREGNILSEIVRRAWDARDLGTMTKASPLRVTRPHVSIIGHITKDELRRELDDIGAANGTGNRFAWCVVKRSKADPELEPMPEARVSDLAQRVQLAIIHGRKTGRVKLDDDARMVWRNVYPDLSEGKPGLLGAVTARAEAHVLRFALIYALLDLSNTITTEHLTAALALWDYAEASATYIFGDATGDSIADRILTALRHNGEMAQADISDLFGRNVGAGRLGQALETLLSARRATSRQQPPTDRDGNPTTGRPRTIWTATP